MATFSILNFASVVYLEFDGVRSKKFFPLEHLQTLEYFDIRYRANETRVFCESWVPYSFGMRFPHYNKKATVLSRREDALWSLDEDEDHKTRRDVIGNVYILKHQPRLRVHTVPAFRIAGAGVDNIVEWWKTEFEPRNTFGDCLYPYQVGEDFYMVGFGDSPVDLTLPKITWG